MILHHQLRFIHAGCNGALQLLETRNRRVSVRAAEAMPDLFDGLGPVAKHVEDRWAELPCMLFDEVRCRRRA
jgi:hypothetical protein